MWLWSESNSGVGNGRLRIPFCVRLGNDLGDSGGGGNRGDVLGSTKNVTLSNKKIARKILYFCLSFEFELMNQEFSVVVQLEYEYHVLQDFEDLVLHLLMLMLLDNSKISQTYIS